METLSNIAMGKQAFVQSLCAEEAMQRRLLDLGLTKGAKIICLYESPFYGEPQTKKGKTSQRHVNSDYTQQQCPRFAVMTSRGLPLE